MHAVFVQEVMGEPHMKELLTPSVLRSHGSIPCFAVLRGGDVLVHGRMLPRTGFARVRAQHAAMLLMAVCWML